MTLPAAAPLVSVMVPWWDHGELLALWRDNVQHLSGCEAIFVDNGSAQPTRDALVDFCRTFNVSLIRNETNRGFAAANNQGASIARGEFLLFLNNDVQIRAPFAHLIATNAPTGLAGPRLLINDLYCRYVEGWCLCVSRANFLKLGGWAEEYTLGYWDDVDLATRALLAGMTLTPVPQLQQALRHLGNTTGRDGRIDQLALDLRNRQLFIRKYFAVKPKVLIDAVVFQTGPREVAQAYESIFRAWAGTDFGRHLVILDREGCPPTQERLRHRVIHRFDAGNVADDGARLQQLCDQEQADLLISTGETAAMTTPSIIAHHHVTPLTPDAAPALEQLIRRSLRI